MTRIAYLDCFAGISGDMLLGAIIDAGLPLERLDEELAKLRLTGFRLSAAKTQRASLVATQVIVDIADEGGHRTPGEFLRIVAESDLAAADKEKASAILRRLAAAEAKVHGADVESLTLHELGSLDTIVDIVGAVCGLRLLGVEELYSSPLPLGSGSVQTEHGLLPLPAPATLALLSSVHAPVSDATWQGETVTPTGAAIVAELAIFQRPAMTVDSTGYGAGGRDPHDHPNVLRLWLGERLPAEHDVMLLIETNIDDMSPELLAYAQERLFAAGGADVWFTPIQMKKNRPAVMLSLLCRQDQEEALTGILLRETTTLGVRVQEVRRHEALREVFAFESTLGKAAVKVKRLPGARTQVYPEYEDCRRLAQERGLPLAEVYRIVEAEAVTQIEERGVG